MKRLSVLLLIVSCLIAPLTAVASAAPRGATAAEEEEQTLDTPLADPYVPPAGDPDPFATEEIPGQSTSPLNPAED